MATVAEAAEVLRAARSRRALPVPPARIGGAVLGIAGSPVPPAAAQEGDRGPRGRPAARRSPAEPSRSRWPATTPCCWSGRPAPARRSSRARSRGCCRTSTTTRRCPPPSWPRSPAGRSWTSSAGPRSVPRTTRRRTRGWSAAAHGCRRARSASRTRASWCWTSCPSSAGTSSRRSAPLEDGAVSVVRVGRAETFPARFTLVAAMNPCPCGMLGAADRVCSCPPRVPERYLRRVSGPLRDRIDLWVAVDRVPPAVLVGPASPEPTVVVARRIAAARDRQRARTPGRSNGRLRGRELRAQCALDDNARPGRSGSRAEACWSRHRAAASRGAHDRGPRRSAVVRANHDEAARFRLRDRLALGRTGRCWDRPARPMGGAAVVGAGRPRDGRARRASPTRSHRSRRRGIAMTRTRRSASLGDPAGGHGVGPCLRAARPVRTGAPARSARRGSQRRGARLVCGLADSEGGPATLTPTRAGDRRRRARGGRRSRRRARPGCTCSRRVEAYPAPAPDRAAAARPVPAR